MYGLLIEFMRIRSFFAFFVFNSNIWLTFIVPILNLVRVSNVSIAGVGIDTY